MDAMIKVCPSLDKKSVKLATGAVVSVMKTAYETRASDEVTLAAIASIKAAISVNAVHLNNVNISNDDSKKVVVNVPDDFGVTDDR